jgi:hypothetical protein
MRGGENYSATTKMIVQCCYTIRGNSLAHGDKKIMGCSISTPLLNLNIMDLVELMVIIHGWPLQMMKQTFPYKERSK